MDNVKFYFSEEIVSYIDSLRYFWEEKRDLERYTGFDREKMFRICPEILKVWDDYKTAEKRMTFIFKSYCPNCGKFIKE